MVENFKYGYILSIYMKTEQLVYHEQIMRKVAGFGNGAHVFAPKEWMNEQVLVIRLEKKSIKEQVLESLQQCGPRWAPSTLQVPNRQHGPRNPSSE